MSAKHNLKLSVVIPAYNEEQNLTGTIHEISPVLQAEGIPYELIIVNDNSSDATPQVIQALMQEDPNIRTVDRRPPGGFGRAIRAGLDVVEGDIVAVYMADQSDDPKDLVASYSKIEQGYDCVFGSRFIKGSEVTNYPPFKLFANRIVNHAIRWLFWTRFNDLTNAFKVYRTEVIRECGPYRASHFNLTIEMSLSALIRGYSIAEIPISWRGRTWGSSNLHISEMGRRYLQVLLKLWFEQVLIRDDILEERLMSRSKRSNDLAELEARLKALEEKLSGNASGPGDS
ncbi:MAG: glycosyltransferase [Candidatus Hydrogenedens sp.]|nr:glycosyltransferase [Candidatus Hydrogenedens sp.]